MPKPVNNFYQKIAETPDAAVELGKVNSDGVTSAFKVTCAEEGGGIKPHYFQMDMSGDSLTKGRKGGTIARGGGSFQVKHGDYVGDGIPGVYIDSGNGDLVLISQGRIRIIAEDIDLIATGASENGNININASTKINISTNGGIAMNATEDIIIHAQVGAWLEGQNSVYVQGKDAEVVDGATSFKGSTGIIPNPLGTIEEMKRKARAWIGG